MYKLVIFTALFALCNARPGNIGLGLGFGLAGHGIAAPALAVAPAVSINSGVSSQSRVDYRTPVVTSIASPAVIASPGYVTSLGAPGYATALGVPGYATSTIGVGLSSGLGYGNGVRVGLNGIGYGH